MSNAQDRVVEAEKKVGAVLAELEASTGGDVKDIGLQDMVDTDHQTGKPIITRAVDIKLNERPQKTWSR